MQAVIGYFMLGTWITMVWAAVKVVQEVRAALRDWRQPLRTRVAR
jgi:hypothetical protein